MQIRSVHGSGLAPWVGLFKENPGVCYWLEYPSAFDDPCMQTGLHSTGHFLPDSFLTPFLVFFKGLWGSRTPK